MRVKDRVAIVTGSARGIGEATARRLAEEGARVVVTDILDKAGEETARSIRETGAEAIYVHCDITDRSQVKGLVDAALERWGRVDILVNNAGFNKDARIDEMSEELWDSVVNTCLKGTFNCCQFAVPHMIAQKYGKIVNISSRAWWGNPGQANYSAAKAGVVGLTRALAKELGRHNINVNAIAPGLTETELVRSHPKYDMIRDMALKNQPLQRLGQPVDIANAVLFLASDESSFITGELIHVTGGRFS